MKVVVLAGGGGTRLWPLSTEEKPKQFLRLFSNKSMVEETLDRLDFLEPKDIFVAINKKHLPLIQEICPNIPQENIILEPDKRDTASAIGYAAAVINNRYPDEVMALISADHHIKEKQEFKEKLKKAEKIAKEQNTLNIIEVIAKTPNTNFGYVKLGEKIDEDIYKVSEFTEKPDIETAKKFIESGDYLWNTGMYVWKASTLLKYYKELLPETYKKLEEIIDNPEKINEIYPTLEKISIDYAIMERVDPEEIRIIKADLGWIDVGNWHTLYEILENEGSNGDAKIITTEEMNKHTEEKIQIDDLTIVLIGEKALISKLL